jgi:hypothetical protein
MTSSYNGDFFTVTATVIPVFFLALTLQGNFLVRVASATVKVGGAYFGSFKDLFQMVIGGENVGGLWKSFLGTVFYVMAGFCTALVGGSIWAEIASLLALKDQQASTSTERFIFLVTAGLALTLGLACVLAVVVEIISKPRTGSATPGPAAKSGNDAYISTADELSKLTSLRDSGALSDEELTSEKNRLLTRDS